MVNEDNIFQVDKCSIYGTINSGEKKITIDKLAEKELKKCSHLSKLKFKAVFNALSKHGYLKHPVAKKLAGYQNLYEIRIRTDKNWRAIYAYTSKNKVVILSSFIKKTQKTPQKELLKARQRLMKY